MALKHPVFTRKDDEIKCHMLPHQLKAKDSKKRISGIVGGRGCGKSIFLSAMALLEIIQGGKVLLLAQNYKSLRLNLFQEVINRFFECGFKPLVNYAEMSIKFGNGVLYGFSYENVDSVRGISGVSMLMLDELALAPNNLFETVTPCLRGSTRQTRILFATSPRKGSTWNKWFKDTTVEKDIFTASMLDNTELDEAEIDLQKKTIKDEMAYRQEILGEILDDDVEWGIIKQADYPLIKKPAFGIRKLGIDCAGSGGDNNEFVVVDDVSILEKVTIQIADTYQLYNIANDLIKKYDIRRVNIDCTGGFGNGIADMINHKNNIAVNRINFAQKPNNDIYLNARAEMYFNLVDKIKEGFYIDDLEIKEELQFTTYNINGTGKTLLCPKNTIKEMIGRSPDSADALALALYDMQVEEITPQESLNIALQFVGI